MRRRVVVKRESSRVRVYVDGGEDQVSQGDSRLGYEREDRDVLVFGLRGVVRLVVDY